MIGVRELVESLGAACLVLDDNHSVLDANRKALELCAAETLAGKGLDAVFAAQDVPLVRDELAHCHAEPRSFTARIIRGDGSELLGNFVATRHDDDLGTGFYVLIAHEVGHTMDAAHETDTYRFLLDNSLDGIVAHTLDGNLIYANPVYREQAKVLCGDVPDCDLPWQWIGDADAAPARIAQLFRHRQARFENERDGTDGLTVHQEVYARLIESPDGQVVLASIRDISERVRAERLIRHLAFHDALTGLPNRTALHEVLDTLASRSDRYDELVGLIFMDLKDFKPVNDTYGHVIGDRVLQVIGNRLERALRETDTVARYGGDEFVVVLPNIPDAGCLDTVADKLADEISQPIAVPGGEVVVHASLGTVIRRQGETTESLLTRADFQMYENREYAEDGSVLDISGSEAGSVA